MINQLLYHIYAERVSLLKVVMQQGGLRLLALTLLTLLMIPSSNLPAMADTEEEMPEKQSTNESGGKKVVDRPTFYCDTEGEVPRTVVKTPSGEQLTFINWKSNAFGGNFTPEKRCQVVSERLQNYSDSGKLENLIASNMNGVGVICVGQGSSCDSSLPDNGLVITARPGVDPKATLRQIAGFRNGSGGELTETIRVSSGLSSLNMYCYLRKQQMNYASCATSRNNTNTAVSAQPTSGGSRYSRPNNSSKPATNRRF